MSGTQASEEISCPTITADTEVNTQTTTIYTNIEVIHNQKAQQTSA